MSRMYKRQSKQVGISDFGMPLGLKLDPENRWVKKAETIPWEEIEERYAALFESEKGNVAKPLRLALGALIIQTERQISDTETPMQIQETPGLQYFCGMPGYTNKLPFEASSMVHFRKRLTQEILGEINEMIIAKAENRSEPPPPDEDESGENEGTLTMDATCAPQNIRYPLDLSLLNEARENLEAMIDELHDPADPPQKACGFSGDPGKGVKPRTYRRKARKEYLNTARKRKKSAKELRKAIKKQLNYIKRDWGIVTDCLANGKALSEQRLGQLEIVELVYEQQLFMWENRVHSVENRIISLSQPCIRPIVRGKAGHQCGQRLHAPGAQQLRRLQRKREPHRNH